MRVILILWFVPIALFGSWYGLSANDVHFGQFFLKREFHDLVFTIYGKVLHMPAEDVPALVAAAIGFDSLIVLGLAALRWRKAWLPQAMAMFGRQARVAEPAMEPVSPVPLRSDPAPIAE